MGQQQAKQEDYPASEGLDVIDCTGVLIENTDLQDSCRWAPPTSVEHAPLPGCEHFAALASIESSAPSLRRVLAAPQLDLAAYADALLAGGGA